MAKFTVTPEKYAEYGGICKRTIKGYAWSRGYNTPTDSECTDVFHEVLAELMDKPETWEEMQEQAKEEDKPVKALFARQCRNAYRRTLYNTTNKEVLEHILDDSPILSRLPVERYSAIDRGIIQEEERQYIKSVTTIEEHACISLLLKGYTEKDIAKELRKGKRTIQRYIASARKAIDKDTLFA